MVIQTLDKSYIVVKRCDADTKLEKYLCRDSAEEGYVVLFRTRDRSFIAKTVEFLTREAASRVFTDFKGYFVSGEYFCIVLAYHDGESLKNRLERENCTLEERLEIGSRILEKIVLLNMPAFFLCDSLKPAQITVSRSLDVEFNYELHDVENYRTYEFPLAKSQFADIMELLFRDELKRRMIPPLTQYYRELEKESMETCMDLYRGYQEMREKIQIMPAEELKKPKTWLFLMWEKLKKIGKPLKHLLAAFLLAAAVFYLMYTVKQAQSAGESQKVFQYIGTLKLE